MLKYVVDGALTSPSLCVRSSMYMPGGRVYDETCMYHDATRRVVLAAAYTYTLVPVIGRQRATRVVGNEKKQKTLRDVKRKELE